MATATGSNNDPPLDEIQWRHPPFAAQMQGIHSNSVLMYFAESPFFDRTSNNALLLSQAMVNPSLFPVIQTREAFEARLRTMSGLEFIVAQEPAEMAPGTGTGVWVIRKQTRRKRQGEEDDIAVHAAYYVVGDNIYQAPTLADILGFRVSTIASALSKVFPAADAVRTWSPSQGHMYKVAPGPNAGARSGRALLGSKEATPMPDSQQQQTSKSNGAADSSSTTATKKTAELDARLAEQSFAVHMQFGGEYMDENPITGGPGGFHLSSTGRKPDISRLQIPTSTASTSASPAAAANANAKNAGKDEKGTATPKTPKTPTSGLPSKPKRRKSKQSGGAGAGGSGPGGPGGATPSSS